LNVLALVFAVVGVLRVGMAKRHSVWLWRGLTLALVLLLIWRLSWLGLALAWVGIALAVVAGLVWWSARPRATRAPDPELVEARRVLGVTPKASRADIIAAHRSRIAAAHPDRGGSDQEAARLNAARDLLLKSTGP
jgi:hypothetical protein